MLDIQYEPTGYNIGINIGYDAGQTIMHLHVHLISRYKGDADNPRGSVMKVQIFITFSHVVIVRSRHLIKINGILLLIKLHYLLVLIEL